MCIAVEDRTRVSGGLFLGPCQAVLREERRPDGVYTRSFAQCGEGSAGDGPRILAYPRCAYTPPLHTSPLLTTTPHQIDLLSSVYGSLFNIFLSSLYHTLDALPQLKPAEIRAFLDILEHVRDSGLLEQFDVDMEARLRDVQEKIKQVAAFWYENMMKSFSAQPGVNRALPLLLMTDEIEKTAKLLDKRFPEPLLG